MEGESYKAFERFREENRHLSQRASPAPEPCSAVRTVPAGGALSGSIIHPSYVPFEQFYRKLTEQAMFTATPSRPYSFELGSFAVPKQMIFIMGDVRWDVYRQSGAAVNDYVPLEEGRMSTLFGFDIKYSDFRKANMRYEIDPVPIQIGKEAFASSRTGGTIAGGQGSVGGFASPATPEQFNLARYASTQNPAGPGLSLQPFRTARPGARGMPWSEMVTESQTVQMIATVFQPLPIPLAFFEVSLRGFLVPKNSMDMLLDTMKPCTGGKM